ncbi:hypothetical protein Tco_0166252, partial [Tanacetum coccineum]
MVAAATPDCYSRCRISAPPQLTTTVSHWHRNHRTIATETKDHQVLRFEIYKLFRLFFTATTSCRRGVSSEKHSDVAKLIVLLENTAATTLY